MPCSKARRRCAASKAASSACEIHSRCRVPSLDVWIRPLYGTAKPSKIGLHLCSYYAKTQQTFGIPDFFGFLASGDKERRGGERRGGEKAPIAKYPKKSGIPKVYASLLDRFALCRLRNLPRSQAPVSKHRSRNACSGVPGRLGPNPVRRRASVRPALRLSGWLAS